MDAYSNFLSTADPEFISMQANYLRMLANYYKSHDHQPQEPEENILERSLQAESIFLQNDTIDLETTPTENHCREILSFSPPCKNDEPDENIEEPCRTSFFSKDSEIRFVGAFNELDENYVKKTPVKRQQSYGNDEQPIRAGGSFEQLLERELRKANGEGFVQEVRCLPPRIKSNKSVNKPFVEDLPLKKPEIKETLRKIDLPRGKVSAQNGISKLNEETFTPKTKPSEESPKVKAKFLKRGEGKLCVERKSLTKASSVNCSKVIYTEKFDNVGDSNLSDKDEDDFIRGMYLDEQIKHYNNENLKLQKLIKEVEDKKKRLDREKNEFLKEKEKKIEEFEKWKAEETEKIRKDKLAYEKKLRMQMKEKDEVQELKVKLQKLEKEKKEMQDMYEKEIKAIKERGRTAKKEVYVKSEVSDEVSENEFDHEDKIEDFTESFEPASEDLEEKSNENFEESSEEDLDRPTAGKKEIVYSNGIRKEVYPDGYSVVYFTNKDVKQCFVDGRIVYHYAEAKTTQTTFPDGMQLFKFANGQIEKHFPDGSKEISFQDGTVKCVYPDGQEESVFPDGTVQTLDSKGVRYIEFVNGQKDTIYPNGVKIRKFPDGRVKKIMPDGKVVEQ